MEGLRIDRLEVKRDERGWLTEVLRSGNLPGHTRMSQLFVTVGNPGKTKGKHYHTRKTEWFSVITGNANLYLRDLRTDEEKIVPMGEDNMVTVTIPPHVAHAIACEGEVPFYLIVVASEDFNSKDSDTYSFDFPGI
jgi:UDP-2-acetamido-2,6-beta-L-arabino-hexul-4-ose reductase